MRWNSTLGVLGMLACAAASTGGAAFARETVAPSIHIEDAQRFFEIYDAAGGKPSAEVLQREYLDKGTPGLHHLARSRRVSGQSIAAAIQAKPHIYRDARACLAVLPRVRKRVAKSMARLKRLYPAAVFPEITIAVSHTKPVGMADANGVQIGLEGLCATKYMNPDNEDRFVHVIIHEFGHSQQGGSVRERKNPTVLELALREGASEFLAELVSGSVGNLGPVGIAKGREREIETRFEADMDKKDISDWFFNGTNEEPGDLGYWVGYRIIKSYYKKARDKRKALKEIFRIEDAREFLKNSGWRPGIAI